MTEEELAKIIEKAGIYGDEKLWLIDNQLTSLPESIGSLSNLNILYLWGNQLTSLPESISNLTNLSILDISGNQFIHLSDSICNLANLHSLNVICNQLTNLPRSPARTARNDQCRSCDYLGKSWHSSRRI